ncbi:MAG: hypothetical protein WBX27_20635 [Specibacter sp.]
MVPETRPAIVATKGKRDLLTPGFGSERHLDDAALAALRKNDADIVSLCLGLNISGASHYLPPFLKGLADVAGMTQPVRG